jgi:hypothetical protein
MTFSHLDDAPPPEWYARLHDIVERSKEQLAPEIDVRLRVAVELDIATPQDSCTPANEDHDQYLVIGTYDAGGGPFVVMSTQRFAWDCDKGPALMGLVRAFSDMVQELGQ